MTHTRDQSFHKIPDWLKEIDTDPMLLDLLTSFWHGEEITLDADVPPMLQNMYKTMVEIGLHQMWTGFLPAGMVQFQEEYYLHIGSKRSGKKWGTDFVGKMIRATHGLWMERNNILHLRTADGIKGLCHISLQTAVEHQWDLGHENLDEKDHYLLEGDVETIMTQPVEMIRGWLCEILIARSDFA